MILAGITMHADQHDPQQRMVRLAVTGTVESMPTQCECYMSDGCIMLKMSVGTQLS